MPNLVNPLQLIIDQAAKLSETGTLKKYEERLNVDSSTVVLLIDISGSMDETVENGKRKIDILREALNRELQPGEVVLVFSGGCDRVPNLQSIPEPGGNTAMHLGIIKATSYSPKHTLIVSDGHPDDSELALSAAANLPGVISTLYIGKDGDLEAIAFMAKLARLGCGKAQVCDISVHQNQLMLKNKINALLPS